MKYNKQDIKQFKEIVCPNCRCINSCNNTDSRITNCPKFFNYVLYGTEDGSCPQTKEYINNLK